MAVEYLGRKCPFCKQMAVYYKGADKTPKDNPWQPYSMYACDNCSRTFELMDGKIVEYKVRGVK